MSIRPIGIVLLATLTLTILAAALVAPTRASLAAPTRDCDGSTKLRFVFGEVAVGADAERLVPIWIENAGGEARRVRIAEWDVDLYRVNWLGRLEPMGTQSATVDFIEGYEGEMLAPGARMPLDDLRLPGEAEGAMLLVGTAQDACGAQRVRA